MKHYTLIALTFLMGIFSVNAQIRSGFEFANFDTLRVINGSDGVTKGYYGNADNNGSGKYFYAPILWEDGYWKSGWALSRLIDTTEEPSDYTKHLYAARPGTGAFGVFDQTWAVGQHGAKLYFIDPATGNNLIANMGLQLKRFHYTNTTFAYNSMRYGDLIGKKFGGDSGTDADYFTLTVLLHGKNISSNSYQCDTLKLPLADFTFADNAQDYIVRNWKEAAIYMPLLDSMEFLLSSSDVGDWGMNTPSFFVLDALEFDLVESVNTPKRNQTIPVYPNPSSSRITMELPAKLLDIQWLDMQGRKCNVELANIASKEDGFFIYDANIQHLSAGIYQINLLTAQGVIHASFVKQ